MSSLSEDVKVVLPAADLLDHVLTQLYNTGNGENSEDLHHYPVSVIVSILHFFNGQIRQLYFVSLIASRILN